MKTQNKHSATAQKSPLSFWIVFALALGAGSTANAAPPNTPIDIPNTPIQTGVRIPANVMLVLDDSGSMTSTTPDIRSIGHFCNGALGDHTASPSSDCGTGDVSDGIENSANSNNPLFYSSFKNYNAWRLADGSYRTDNAIFTKAFNDATQAVDGTTATIDLSAANQTHYMSKVFPATKYLADYYRVRFVSGTADTFQICSYTKPVTTWGWNDCANVASYTWNYIDKEGNAASITRTNDQERKNYAVWYAYNRTRSKTAKAGAGFAFGDLGENVRVAFNTIHNRVPFNIPVANENGLFKGTNRSGWYNALYSATASGNTPLLTSLNRSGQYFSSNAVDGPYGSWVSEVDSTLRTVDKQIACRQNFTILTTDGYRNEGAFPQAAQFNDETDGLEIFPGAKTTGPSYQYKPVVPYTSNEVNSLADVAMRYWKTDLRTDLNNLVPTTTIANPAYWQHMVTFALSIGLRGNLDPETDLPNIIAGTKFWPTGIANLSIPTMDDLWHAAVNGRGQFETAYDHEDFARALRSALAEITNRTGSGSNVSANSVSVGSQTRVYQASYQAGQFTGEIQAYPIVNGKIDTSVASWKASEQIPFWNTRKIFTIDAGSGTTFPSTSQATTIGDSEIVDYLKGDQTNAIDFVPGLGKFRKRVNNNVLGDIVNSSPSYVKDSDTVFVGANDGMLHAFNGTTGLEQFAFVPNGIDFTKLKKLSDAANYIHEFFVDGPVVVSSKKQTGGINYLVGSLGRGGKGLFGLNVTNPSTFDASKVLWELNDDGNGYMGHVISRPIITKVRFAGTTKNVAIVSNGVNSTNEHPALFVIDLSTGAILKTLVPQAGTAAVSGQNGLSAPTGVDTNGDSYIDDVYAGDLKGNVWKFNLSADYVASSDWFVANSDAPLFSAVDGAGNPQPISGGINIGFNYLNNTWLFFGTGRLLTQNDLLSTTVQSWYGIIDDGTAKTRADLVQRSIVAVEKDGTKVIKRAFSTRKANDMVGKKGWMLDLEYPGALAVTPAQQGERIVGVPILRGSLIEVSTLIPSNLECDAGGNGFTNVLDAFTGSAGFDGGEGYLDINGNGSFGDPADKIGAFNIGSVDLGVNMPTDALILSNGNDELLIVGGSTGGLGSIPVKGTRIRGRVAWREVTSD